MSEVIAEGMAGWRTVKGPVSTNKSGFRACGHRVLLIGQQKEEYAVSEGGIMLPTATQQKEQQHQVFATVVEIGPDCWSDKAADYCKVGDKVLVGQYVGKFHESPLDGKTYRFVQDLDVITPLVEIS